MPNLVENGDADIWMGKAIVVIQTAETNIATCDGYADDLAAAKGGAAKGGGPKPGAK